VRNPRMRWSRTRPRHDGSPTDTQTDTENRSPRQVAADHCLMSRRRRCAVLLRELHKARAKKNKNVLVFLTLKKKVGKSKNKHGQDKVAMDTLVRKRTAEEDVDETVEAETQDHMDHTFTGIMWDVASALFVLCISSSRF
jgi:hypothetical protein